MQELYVKIMYDPTVISETQITDSMNEWHHGLALDLSLHNDDDTNGYVGYDWEYSRP